MPALDHYRLSSAKPLLLDAHRLIFGFIRLDDALGRCSRKGLVDSCSNRSGVLFRDIAVGIVRHQYRGDDAHKSAGSDVAGDRVS